MSEIFYNTDNPNPLNKNTINSISPNGIRDFLLKKNIISNYIKVNNYRSTITSVNGEPAIGEPRLDTTVNSGYIQGGNGDVRIDGVFYRDFRVNLNKYKSNEYEDANIDGSDVTIKNQFINGLAIDNNVPISQNYLETISNESDLNNLKNKTEYLTNKSTNGPYFRKNRLLNLYVESEPLKDGADSINKAPTNITKNLKTYIEEYGFKNSGNPVINGVNIIGTVLSGQALGLSRDGIDTNFDIRTTLAGRALGTLGLIKETPLGIEAAKGLGLAISNNVAFNIQQEAVGALNIQENIYNVIKGSPIVIPRPNYRITKPKSDAVNYLSRLLGFNIPKSYLEDEGSLFFTENKGANNIDRANSMIINTGAGQINALKNNLFSNIKGISDDGSIDNPDQSVFRSGYAPGLKDNRGRDLLGNRNGSNFSYLFSKSDGTLNLNILESVKSGSIIPKNPYDLPSEELLNNSYDYVYSNLDINYRKFSWLADSKRSGELPKVNINTDSGVPKNRGNNVTIIDTSKNKKSLLVKTQMLFNDVGMKNIISTKGDMGELYSTQITSTNSGGMSRGSAVLTSNSLFGSQTEAENHFCRSWTNYSRYEKVENLIRHGKDLTDGIGIDGRSPYRLNGRYNNTVLDDNGFVKIAPYKENNIKKYMFSIENLAWADDVALLPDCEIGPGDTVNNLKGRIMWFPPYDINFSENTSVNIESSQFIGRGEPVYTYNNTERTGNLSFKLVVDHPSYVNELSKITPNFSDNEIASFFAGCYEMLTKEEREEIKQLTNITPEKPKVIEPQKAPSDFYVYFPNDRWDIPVGYESGLSGSSENDKIDYDTNTTGSGFGIGGYNGELLPQRSGKDRSVYYEDKDNYGLNGYRSQIKIGDESFNGFFDIAFMSSLRTYMQTVCTSCKVEVIGAASSQGHPPANKILATNRAETMKNWFVTFIFDGIEDRVKTTIVSSTGEVPNSGENGQSINIPQAKQARRSQIKFYIDNNEDLVEQTETVKTPKIKKEIINRVIRRLYSECDFFEKLEKDSPIVYNSYKEKLKYFHPSFHSTTPEGFNSRLTFLNQCTRQGPTKKNNYNNVDNLSFGRPPVCILRVGDFYHTKIYIESLSISYEPLVWDLNPEGIGVQPMIANVDLAFKFLGGSSLDGPISRLQNALSFNFYANTQVYDKRSDIIENGTIKVGASGITSQENIDTLVSSQETNVDENQIDQNEIENSGQSSPTNTNDNTPKILGFKSIYTNGWGDNPNSYSVSFTLLQKGLFEQTGNNYNQLVTDDELRDFLNKGIKVVLDLTPNPISTSRFEEVINGSITLRTDSKGVMFLFDLGYQMGVENPISSGGFRINNLIKGNYMLKLFYDGKPITQIPIPIGELYQEFF